MRPAAAVRANLNELRGKVETVLVKKRDSIKNGVCKEDCAKLVAWAAKLKDPLDGKDPTPIPPVCREFN